MLVIVGCVPEPTPTPTPTADEPDATTLVSVEPFTTGVLPGTEGRLIKYRTVDGVGGETVASATVLASTTASDDPAPVLVYGHGTTGIAPHCAPSRGGQPFGPANSFLHRLVSDGWVAVLPDYAGLGSSAIHPYLVGETVGRNMLDAVIAAGEIDELDLDPRTVSAGESQGGHASLWTASLADDYAPDIDLVGSIALAPATDLLPLTDVLNETVFGAPLAALLVVSWFRVFPELGLEQQVPTELHPALLEMASRCIAELGSLDLPIQAFELGPIITEEMIEGDFASKLVENSADGPFAAPLLIVHGDQDPLISVDITRDWASRMCADGVELQYFEEQGGDHGSVSLPSAPFVPAMVAWAKDRVAGEPLSLRC